MSTKTNSNQSTPQAQELTRREFLAQAAVLPAAALPAVISEPAQPAPKQRKQRKPSCTKSVPSEVYTSGEWLKDLKADPLRNASEIRIKLFYSNAYHTRDVSGDEGWNAYEANCRVMIEQLLPLLHRNDLAALADLAKAFYTQPPTAEEFAHIEELTRKENEAFRKHYERVTKKA